MQLTSPEFGDGGEMPWTVSAANENRLPTLEVKGLPTGTVSLAIILEDLDSPVGKITHWLAWNLPADTQRIDALAPAGKHQMGMSGFGKIGYVGPTPPEGRHRYQFTLFALDTRLALHQGSNRQHFDTALKGHILATAQLNGTIQRQASAQ
ncbi:MAG: YbhB/YbcL family Raf kinase inhibitor-like protein [Spiribacter sp.]|jgi:hypothetical protein|nr:YbhB/YbcL family Raf kinase inhibitor-like protein [Spiribacter sp.]MDR9489746.1 YbhB/YbcL family Raf kinase inhibitor-like protein [Spiribacter sp.]